MTAQRDWHSEPEPADEIRRRKALHDDAGPLRLTIAVLGSLVILGVVLYGLNRPHPQYEGGPQQTAASTQAPPQQPGTTGAAPKQ